MKSKDCQSGLFDEVLCPCLFLEPKKMHKDPLVQAQYSLCSPFGVMGEDDGSSLLGKTFSV